jgi:hypothetical protein
MVPSKAKLKRSKAMTIMLLPALIITFTIGWILYCIGANERSTKVQYNLPQKDFVTIGPIIFEETPEIKE